MRFTTIGAAVLLALFFVFVILVYFIKMDGGETEFAIEGGQSLSATARLLAEGDIIISRYVFMAYAIVTGHEKDFKAGRYVLPDKASIRELVSIFSDGRSVADDIVVTIPEGTNMADTAKILAEAELVDEEAFLTESLEHEGFLFPDTYRFQKSNSNTEIQNPKTAVEDIIQKMRKNFDQKTKGIFMGLTVLEIRKAVVIASMLEKEVQTEEDMRLVAGIIGKRLKNGIPLQIDATVAYGVCYWEFLRGRYCDASLANIVDNLKVNSEYNTYIKDGLPIGPISNPGLKAIRAALNPQPSDYLYYLSARDGMTIFSKTLEEHERNRVKYLKIVPSD